MADIAAIGFDSDVLALKVCGIDAYPVKNAEETSAVLEKLADKYSLIIIDEALIEYAKDTVKKFDNMPVPVIFPVPLSGKSTGRSRERISSIVRKAIGISEEQL